MAHAFDTTQPDLAAVKQKQQLAWSSGDFAVVASRIVLVAEQLCDTADLHAGWRVLDVATGSGNAAIAAARHGCTAVGVDYVPSLLERGRQRAAAEGLAVELARGRRRGAAVRATRRSTPSRRSSARMFAPDHAEGRRRAAPRLPARRHDRPRRAGRPRASSASCSDDRAARPAARRRAVADALGHRGAPARAVRRRHQLARGDASGRSRSASRRRSTSSTFFRLWYGPTLKAFAAARGRRPRRARDRPDVALARRSTGSAPTRSRSPRPTPRRSRSTR